MNGAHIFPFVLSRILEIPLIHLLYKTFSYFKGHLSYHSKYPWSSDCLLLSLLLVLFFWLLSSFTCVIATTLSFFLVSCVSFPWSIFDMSYQIIFQSKFLIILLSCLKYFNISYYLQKEKCPVSLLYHAKLFLLWSIQNWFHFSLPIHICDILTGVLGVEWTSTRVLDSEVTQKETHRSFQTSSPWGGF